jgi:hypothetical protein
MKVIRANCRIQFTPLDISFLLQTLESRPEQREALQSLFGDEDSRNLLLDSDTVFEAVIENPENLSISLHLFFYILVRRVLMEVEIEDESVADYVAELLAEFTRASRSGARSSEATNESPALDSWLGAIQNTDRRECFELKAFAANRLLFLTGIQEDWLRRRTARRGAPSLEFYETVGPGFYREAGHHELAESYELRNIFEQLSERFHDARLALNDLATRLIHLDTPQFPILEARPTSQTSSQGPEELPRSLLN